MKSGSDVETGSRDETKLEFLKREKLFNIEWQTDTPTTLTERQCQKTLSTAGQRLLFRIFPGSGCPAVCRLQPADAPFLMVPPSSRDHAFVPVWSRVSFWDADP